MVALSKTMVEKTVLTIAREGWESYQLALTITQVHAWLVNQHLVTLPMFNFFYFDNFLLVQFVFGGFGMQCSQRNKVEHLFWYLFLMVVVGPCMDSFIYLPSITPFHYKPSQLPWKSMSPWALHIFGILIHNPSGFQVVQVIYMSSSSKTQFNMPNKRMHFHLGSSSRGPQR